MNATEQIARFIANTRYEDIPRPVLDATRTIILDGVANVLAGSTLPVLEHVRRYVERLGGRPDCTVIGASFKTNPLLAAFANGAAMHVLDYEPQGIPSTHGTSAILPAFPRWVHLVMVPLLAKRPPVRDAAMPNAIRTLSSVSPSRFEQADAAAGGQNMPGGWKGRDSAWRAAITSRCCTSQPTANAVMTSRPEAPFTSVRARRGGRIADVPWVEGMPCGS